MSIDPKFTQAFKAYMDACDIYDEQSYEDARTGCINYVLQDFPRYRAAYAAYKGRGSYQSIPSDIVKLGNAIHLVMGRISSKYKPVESVSGNKHKSKHSVGANNAKRTAYEKYASWVENHDTVTLDEELAHFLGVDRSTLSRYRNQLVNAGYQFEYAKTRDKWLVTAKPAKVKVITNGSSDLTAEDLILLEKLLKKLRG